MQGENKKRKMMKNDKNENALFELINGNGNGVTWDTFCSEYWEKKPLIVRQGAVAYENTLTRQSFIDVLKKDTKNNIEYARMKICKYDNEEKMIIEPKEEFASGEQVDEYFNQGYSVQFYQPQRENDAFFQLMSEFESSFGVLSGASVYLTPAKTQALAPHHDDVEVFVLQTEGRKHWKLYEPILELPGEHSGDIDPKTLGEPMMEVTLNQGDMMYLPRGVIHQALADSETFSTHVTVSVYQYQSWANFLEVALPRVVRQAFDEDVRFRKGLPINYLNYMGSVHDMKGDSKQSEAFVCALKELISYLPSHVDSTLVHQTADEAAMDFVKNRLPPVNAPCHIESIDTPFCLADPSFWRLVVTPNAEGDIDLTVVHSLNNDRTCHMGASTDNYADDGESEDEDEIPQGDEDETPQGEEGCSDHESTSSQSEEEQAGTIHLPDTALSVILHLLKTYPQTSTVASVHKQVPHLSEDIIRGALICLEQGGLLVLEK